MTHWEPPYKTIDVNGIPIAYTEAGSGKTILLIHGYSGAAAIWEYQVPIFSKNNQVLALDLPGHGNSAKPRLNYTPDFFIRTVEGFMDAMQVRDAIVIGHSMGGAIAQAIAFREPERVTRLILIDSLSPGSSPASWVLKAVYSLRNVPLLQKGYLSLPGTITTRISLHYMVCDKNLITDEVISRFHALKKADGFDYAQISAPRHFEKWLRYREEIKKITQPTLIIWGEKDRYLSPGEGVRLSRMIQNARLIMIPDTGHLPMWERPDAVNPEIKAFL